MFRRDLLPPRPSHGRVAAWVVGVGVARAILTALYNALGDVQAGESGDFARRLADEFTALATAIPLFALVALGVARWPLGHAGWRRHLAPVAVLFVAYSVLHTLAMELLRWAVYPLLGGARDISPRALGLAMGHEMPNDLFYFALLVGCVELWRFWWSASERERREKALERSLAQAQLTALRLQLQPHFLFNALNTVSAAMYDDPRAADAMLGELAELLRASLRADRHDLVPLRDEVAIAERYVRLQQARFGDRLRVTFDIAESVGATPVPVFLLQPLVENAVRHGGVERRGHGEVRVRAAPAAAPAWVAVEVWDDGEAVAPAGEGSGLGLRATAERLRLLFGDRAQFSAGAVPDGWRVQLTVPAASAAASAAAGAAQGGA